MYAGQITVDGRPVGEIDIAVKGGADDYPFLQRASYTPEGDSGPSSFPSQEYRGTWKPSVEGPERGEGGQSHHRSHRGPSQREIRREDTPDLHLADPAPQGSERVYGRLAEARDRARAELQAKPWLNEKALHIFAGENPDPQASTALWESAINRMAVRGTTLEKELRRHASSGRDEGGYYAGYSHSLDPKTRHVLENSRDRALSYSNVSNYATDNSSGALAEREKASGSFQHRSTYNRESFFAPGRAEPAWRDNWRSLAGESRQIQSAAKSLEDRAPENTQAAATGEEVGRKEAQQAEHKKPDSIDGGM